MFWGSFAKKYKPFGESQIRYGESDTFWQNLKRFGETPIQSGKTLYYLAKVGSFAKLYRVLLNSTKASHIYGGGYYGAAERCTADLLQSGKPMGAGLSVKIENLAVSVLVSPFIMS